MTAARSRTIGVLHLGEMGAALASALAGRGARVVTTLQGRGELTARRCREAGVGALDTFADVVRQSDVVFSLVPPAAAEEIAAAYRGLADLAPPKAIYVDANSIGPEAATAMAARMSEPTGAFVDAAINGLAKNLTTGGTLFLSGHRAAEVAALVGDAMRVELLGDVPGRAKAMKMLLSGLSKGLCALFVEAALTAHRHAMLPEMIEAYTRIYPGVMAVVDRMLPTYDRHAGRRADEMRELEQTARSAGLDPIVLTAVRALHEDMAAALRSGADAAGASVVSLVEHLASVPSAPMGRAANDGLA